MRTLKDISKTVYSVWFDTNRCENGWIIVTIFSTKEKAEKYIKNNIEERQKSVKNVNGYTACGAFESDWDIKEHIIDKKVEMF